MVNAKLSTRTPRQLIEVHAVDYVKGEGVEADKDYNCDFVVNMQPRTQGRPKAAEWSVRSPGGKYRLEVEYASGEARPVSVLVNGELVIPSALNAITGGFNCKNIKYVYVGKVITLLNGDNQVRLQRDHVFPHVRSLRFIPVR